MAKCVCRGGRAGLHIMVKLRCPVLSNLNLVSYPFHYRSNIEVPSGTTALGVFYPYNNMVGWAAKQAVYPPDASTLPTNGFSTGPTLEDPFLTSIFTPTSTTADPTQVPAARATDFCVEVSITTPLANLGGDCMIGVWRSTNFPNIGQASGYGQMYSQMVEDPYTKVLPGASFASPVCVHAAMRDRNALEPSAIKLGPTPYYDVLRGVNNPPSTPDYTGVTPPWYPVVLYLANPATVTVNFLITIRGTFEISPAASNAWFRLAIPRPISPAGAEQAWWRYQQKLLSLGPVPGSVLSRSVAGYVGLPDVRNTNTNSTTTTTTKTKKKRGNMRGSKTGYPDYRPRTTAIPQTSLASYGPGRMQKLKQAAATAVDTYREYQPLIDAAVKYYMASHPGVAPLGPRG